nr:NK-lysin 2 [Bubalus bubalis]
MTSWVVLLIASVLLVAPGLAFSGLTPESHDQATAHLCDGDELCQGLHPEHPQGDLLLQGEELSLLCDRCQKIIQHLMDKLGDQPDENTVIEAASKVCSKMGLLKGLCKSIMKRFLRRIAADITAGKTSRVVCVDIKVCKSKPVGFI